MREIISGKRILAQAVASIPWALHIRPSGKHLVCNLNDRSQIEALEEAFKKWSREVVSFYVIDELALFLSFRSNTDLNEVSVDFKGTIGP